MMIWAMLGLLVVIVLHVWWLERLIKKNNIEQIARQKEFEKWLFESLYSINHKVLLPSEHEKPTISKKASVYIPGKDPMAEFNGKQDDYFE